MNGEHHPPPVEVVGAEVEEAWGAQSEPNPMAVHAWLRTAAVVVASIGVLWVGVSAAGVRTANEKQACFAELQLGMFSPGPEAGQDAGARFVEKAEDCGLPLLAEEIRQNYDGD